MILVTGVNGRLGRALVEALTERGQAVRAAARALPTALPKGAEAFALGTMDGETDWSEAVAGVDTIIHCASLTWLPPDTDEAGFRIANVVATRGMAEAARRAGVRRIVYVSSLSVNGKHNVSAPFRHDDVPRPESAYSRSKLEAEAVLRASGVPEIVIVRPPRILWPDLSGNLAMLAKLIKKGVPLPFGLLSSNGRDNVSAENLVDALIVCAQHPAAAGEVFLVSDQQPLSTRSLVERLGGLAGRRPRLLPVPQMVLKAVVALMPSRFLGKLDAKGLLDELTLDLRVDGSRIAEVTGWKPARLRDNGALAKGGSGEDGTSQENHD